MNAIPVLESAALLLGAAIIAAVISLLLTGAIRAQAIARSVLDKPNGRSLHIRPTSRGGGLAIVTVTMVFLAGAAIFWVFPIRVAVAIGGGGLLVAAVGLIDDVSPLPPRLRLVAHFIAATWAAAWLGGIPDVDIGMGTIGLGFVGHVLAVLGLVWFTNLFNFMDGIDGLAGSEALVLATVAGCLLWYVSGFALASLCFVLAGACLGFLWWNWSPARIFMGDVGSGFLGFVFAAIAIAANNSNGVSLLVGAAMAAVFIVDATVTLLRRMKRGHWKEAHRTHAYQRLVRFGWTHREVTLTITTINLVLGALAAAAIVNRQLILPASATAFLLAGLAYWCVERLIPISQAD